MSIPSPQVFRITHARYDPQRRTAHLCYAFDDGPVLEETLEFAQAPRQLTPAQLTAFNHCLRHLHIAAGVSYYKLFVPSVIRVETGTLSAPELALYRRFYVNGLAEFAYVNGLDLNDHFTLIAENSDPDDNAPQLPVTLPVTERALVPVGGGKDSIVTIEALRAAGKTFSLFAVGQHPHIERVARVADVPLVRVRRRLAPQLFDYNRAGALNGHVPITGIISFILACASVLHQCDTLVMSNERSADEPNMADAHGFSINHQYSKTYQFEQDFDGLLREQLLPNSRYFSLLRPLSEVNIAALFAGLPQYHHTFASCNRSVQLDRSGGVRWCCACPKCRFVFLVLAPFMPREALVAIFGTDLLNDPNQVAGYLELLGLGEHKPFECVGEYAESLSLIAALATQAPWQHAPVVQTLAEAINAAGQVALPLDQHLILSDAPGIPASYEQCIGSLEQLIRRPCGALGIR